MPSPMTAAKVACFSFIALLSAILLIIAMVVPYSQADDDSGRRGTWMRVWRGRSCVDGANSSCEGWNQPRNSFCTALKNASWAIQALIIIAIAFLILWALAFIAFNCLPHTLPRRSLCAAFVATWILIFLIVLAIFVIMYIIVYRDVCHLQSQYRGSGGGYFQATRQHKEGRIGMWLVLAAAILMLLGLLALCAWLAMEPCGKETRKVREPYGSHYQQCGPKSDSAYSSSNPSSVRIRSGSPSSRFSEY